MKPAASDFVVVGAASQLGQSLRRIRPDWHYIEQHELDLLDPSAIARLPRAPVIINFAAFTAVDDAEKKRDEAARINGAAVGELAARCEHFVHISTDYVYDGKKTTPYVESDATAPLGHYGQTKLDGERAAFTANKNSVVLRTSWLYSEYNKNFVKTMIQLSQTRDQLKIVSDQKGSPTLASDLVGAVAEIAENPAKFSGEIYHYSNEGACSWYDFTREIFRLKGIRTQVHPITTAEYPTPAKRPAYSVLDKSKIAARLTHEIPQWQTSLSAFLANFSQS